MEQEDAAETPQVAGLTASGELEAFVRPMLEMLQVLTDLDSTFLTQLDAKEGLLHVLSAHNARTLTIPEGATLTWSDALCRRAIEAGRTWSDDVQVRWPDDPTVQAHQLQTYASVPVRLDDGSLFGTLCAVSREARPAPPHAEQALRLLGRVLEQELHREDLVRRLAEANARLEASAHTDALTGLPNRRGLAGELGHLFSQARRERACVLVAFIDLDNFKAINDTWGHASGDLFLQSLGQRLAHAGRGGDLLARVGGDEFVMAGMGPADPAEVPGAIQALQHRLRLAVSGTYTMGEITFEYGGASTGVIAANPVTETPEDALRRADRTMYAIKLERRAEGT